MDEQIARQPQCAYRVRHWDRASIYTVSQKGSVKLMAITLSNLNRFSEFLYR